MSDTSATYYVHPTASVDSRATIGDGTKSWINVQVREMAKIGKNCIISKDVYVDHGVTIGDRCKIQNSVSVYQGVTIEDEVFVGPMPVLQTTRCPGPAIPNGRSLPR